MDVRTFCEFSQGTTEVSKTPRWQILARRANQRFRLFHVPLKRYNRAFEELFFSVLKESYMRIRLAPVLFPTLLLAWAGVSVAQEPNPRATPAAAEGVLKAADVGAKLFPDRVYFRGQVGTAQMRNAGGVRYADGFLVLAALVDSSGYASGIKEKYQAYLITDVAIAIGGQTLKPGAYGCGFIDDNKFVVMDLGANDLFQVPSAKDAEIKRPIPLQFVAGPESGKYRLYQGRDYVEFHRLK
jgi:hypothetical protein